MMSHKNLKSLKSLNSFKFFWSSYFRRCRWITWIPSSSLGLAASGDALLESFQILLVQPLQAITLQPFLINNSFDALSAPGHTPAICFPHMDFNLECAYNDLFPLVETPEFSFETLLNTVPPVAASETDSVSVVSGSNAINNPQTVAYWKLRPQFPEILRSGLKLYVWGMIGFRDIPVPDAMQLLNGGSSIAHPGGGMVFKTIYHYS